MARIFSALLALAAIALTPVSAQRQPDTGSEPLPDMEAIARALGVSCTYCHVEGDFKSDENPKKAIPAG